jgi:hypothetical protein
MKRHYTEAERMEAVALAATVGPLRASQQLGYPMTTVAYWMHRPAASPIIAAAEASIAERLKDAHARALASVMEGLADPHSKLGDRAAALRVLGEQLALAEGRATSRTESSVLTVNLPANSPLAELSAEEREELRRYIEAIPVPPLLTEGDDDA